MIPNPFSRRSRSGEKTAAEPGDGEPEGEHEADQSAGQVDSGEHDGADETVTRSVDDGPEATATSEHTGPEEIDASDTPAPSIGPHTKISKEDPETRLARHEQSGVDAMGLEKRREVIGGSYGASFAKQATLYGLFLLVVGLLAFGAYLAVKEFDQPPEEEKLEAPWRNSTDPAKASEIDFPPDSGPRQVPVEPDPTSTGNTDQT